MEKMEWPRPPVLLGLVLGPLAENRLFLSSDNYGLAWLGRPGVMIIFAIILIGIIYPIIKQKLENGERAASGTQAQAAIEAPKQGGLRFSSSRALHCR